VYILLKEIVNTILKDLKVFLNMNNTNVSKSIYNIKKDKKQSFSKAIKLIEPVKPKPKPKVTFENNDIEHLTLDGLKIGN